MKRPGRIMGRIREGQMEDNPECLRNVKGLSFISWVSLLSFWKAAFIVHRTISKIYRHNRLGEHEHTSHLDGHRGEVSQVATGRRDGAH